MEFSNFKILSLNTDYPVKDKHFEFSGLAFKKVKFTLVFNFTYNVNISYFLLLRADKHDRPIKSSCCLGLPFYCSVFLSLMKVGTFCPAVGVVEVLMVAADLSSP